MINVDISNIWCSASLPQLLELEKEVFDAHCAFRKDSKDLGNRLGWLCLPEHLEQEELERVQQAAAEIRAASSALVIVGQQQACDCSRGVVELLCGTQPDLRPGQTKLIYCPDSLSSRAFQDLMGKLEEIEFSVLVIAGAEMRLQTAVLLRSLRWMMQRLFGTEKANERIYVVTELTRGTLCRLAGEENWTRFDLGRTVGSQYDSLSAAGLLPMAVAGIDIAELTRGAAQISGDLEVRAFENPAWLYSASRLLLSRKGYHTELLCAGEPLCQSFLAWCQGLFACSEGSSAIAPVPVAVRWPQDLDGLGAYARLRERKIMQSVLRFAAPEQAVSVEMDWKNLDGLNYLEDKTLDDVQEQMMLSVMERYNELAVPFLSIDCEQLTPRSVGELVYFMQLSCAISQYLFEQTTDQTEQLPDYERKTRQALGEPSD